MDAAALVHTGVHQCDCFTPKRTLSRSPPHGRAVSEGKENQTPQDGRQRFTRGSCSQEGRRAEGDGGMSPSMREFLLPDGTPYQRRVQDVCFTPTKTLKRSPAAGHTQESLIDAVPPPTRWQLAHTPVQQQLTDIPEAREVTDCQQSPDLRESEAEHSQSGSKPSVPVEGSGQLTVEGGGTYTQIELDYLQWKKNKELCAELETELSCEEKALLRTQQEREHLVELKTNVSRGLEDMRTEYHEAVTMVRTLLQKPDISSSSSSSSCSTEQPSPAPLTNQEVSQLRRERQLTLVELEKKRNAVQTKMADLNKNQQRLEEQLREEEVELEELRSQLSSELHETEEDGKEWQEKVDGVHQQEDQLTEKLQVLEKQLHSLQLSEEGEEEEEKKGEERERAQQKLMMLARRCELFAQRQEKLKKMQKEMKNREPFKP